MRRSIPVVIALPLLAASALPALAGNSPARVRAMTFNVRYDFASDGENRWEHRRDLVAARVLESGATLIGFQEDKAHQVRDLQARLPDFEFVGRGRNATGSGERCSIAYHPRAFRLLDHGDLWLSDTPEIPGSNTWGDEYPRKVTWALLRGRGRRTLLVLNTHLPEGRGPAETTLRRRGVETLRDWLLTRLPRRERLRAPVLLMGDFNSDATKGPLIGQLLEGPYPFRDAWAEVNAGHAWPGTYGGFAGARTRRRIDWLLVGGPIRVARMEKLSTPIEGRLPSDHYPLVADLLVH